MDSWRQSYDELKDYVVSHPTLVINEREIIIPDDLRLEFYSFFDKVREEYIKEMYPALVPEASLLSKNFNTAKEKTLACLNLKEAKVNSKLDRFLRDPMQGLMCELFDPLFRVLQGITDLATFKRVAADILKDLAKTFPHQGYLHWTTLSLMRLLERSISCRCQTRQPSMILPLASRVPGGTRWKYLIWRQTKCFAWMSARIHRYWCPKPFFTPVG
jgi:hypothetical protein